MLNQIPLFALPENPIPLWFGIRGRVPRSAPVYQAHNVRKSLHPLGAFLGPSHSRCATCRFMVWRERGRRHPTEFRCKQIRARQGRPQGVRLKWLGCAMYKRR